MRHNYRAAADPIFCQHLDLIRRGEGPLASDIRYLLVNRQLKCPTVVFATNREADAMNARKVEELSGPKLVYKALNAPVADLTLCKNAHVMTTRSLTLDGERVPNGARGVGAAALEYRLFSAFNLLSPLLKWPSGRCNL